MNHYLDPKRTLTIEKTFKAPVKLVWEAWSDPNHISKWWVPENMEFKIHIHEFKVGGQWKYSMFMPDGKEFISEGEYLEISEHKKIVTTANFYPMTAGVTMEMHFNDEGGETKFEFHVIHPTEEYCKQQEKMGFYNGWGSVLERLNKLVTNAN